MCSSYLDRILFKYYHRHPRHPSSSNVVRYRNNEKRPPNYLARREQRRLLYLVMSLGLIVLLMFEAAKPKNWSWLWMGQPQGAAPTADSPTTDSPPTAPREYDTRVRPTSPDQLPLDMFIAPPIEPAQVDTSGDFFPGVKPEYLKSVTDLTEFRGAEHE